MPRPGIYIRLCKLSTENKEIIIRAIMTIIIIYQQMDGIRNINNEKSNAEESKQFRSNIWDNEKEHERYA